MLLMSRLIISYLRLIHPFQISKKESPAWCVSVIPDLFAIDYVLFLFRFDNFDVQFLELPRHGR